MKTFLLFITILSYSSIAQTNGINKSFGPNNLDSGLVAFFPFNGNANDESGNNNNGTVNGATLTQDRFGRSGYAYSFNGANNFISVFDNPILFSDDLTLSWWYKVSEYSGTRVVLGWVEGGYRYQQFFDGNSLAYLNGYNVTSPGTYFNPTYNVTAVNEWQHVLVTYKKLSESSSTTALYFNGELKQTDNHTLAMAYQSGFNFYIGKTHDGAYFNGEIDDIRIYNRVLNNDEVIELYNDSTTYVPPLIGLVAFYQFNANTQDSSGNFNDGINHNGVYEKDRYGNDDASMFFNGVDSYIEGINPGNNLPVGNSPRTFCAWVNNLEYNQWGSNIFHYGTAQAAPTNFHFLITDVLGLGNGYGYSVVYGTTILNDSTWHFVTGVYEGGTERITKLYVDGQLDTSGVITSEPNTVLGNNWKIGQFIASGIPFKGNIDELRVYNIALSTQQIWDMYKATTTAPNLIFPSNDSTLINPWPTLVLDWDSTITATSYRLLLSNDSLFTTTLHDTSINISAFDFYNWFSVNIDNLYWKVRTINDGGIGPWSQINHFNIMLTDVEEESQLPREFALIQNYPNPFNPSTVIGYQLQMSGNVTLKVYDILGNEVATLVDEEKPAGIYEVEFNPSSIKHHTSSGIYFYQLKAGNFVQTKKMILIK